MLKRFWLSRQTGSFQRRRAHLALIGATIVIVITMAGVVLRASLRAAASDQLSSQRAVVVPTQNVRFTIYPEAIHPASVTVHKGLLGILIEDLAGTENGVVVERLNGNDRVVAGSVKRFERHWRGRTSMEVTPGVYRLRVPDRQIEEAQITVEP